MRSACAFFISRRSSAPFLAQVAALKGQLSAAATRGKTAKGQLVELHESLATQQQRLESLNKKKETAKERLNKEKENIRTAGETTEARKAFYSRVSTRLRQLQQRVKTTRDAFFDIVQKLAEEKEALKIKQGGLSNAKNALKSLQVQLPFLSMYNILQVTKADCYR